MKESKFIWKNGTLIPWQEATTHVLTHGLHYGTGVFEGIRAYKTDRGAAVFRSEDHYKRLYDSGKIYQMKVPYDADTLMAATRQLLAENNLDSCYIRPIAYYGYGEMGLNPGKNKIDVVIAAWEWGTYLGEEGLEKGIRCKISSWTRIDGRIMPAQAKSTANYANSALAKMEAIHCGFDEAIMLNLNGTIAEGPGENIFMIKNGKLYTTPVVDSALWGITCQSVMTLAKDMGLEVGIESMPRDDLFLANELFFTGTAAEITPIREIDGRVIGSGKRGPITEKIQRAFFDIVQGKNDRYSHWLDYVKPV
ncbi:MAG: branched-chain amino acid transaminase [Candidatus Margulisiibacteriota bacterium]